MALHRCDLFCCAIILQLCSLHVCVSCYNAVLLLVLCVFHVKLWDLQAIFVDCIWEYGCWYVDRWWMCVYEILYSSCIVFQQGEILMSYLTIRCDIYKFIVNIPEIVLQRNVITTLNNCNDTLWHTVTNFVSQVD